MQIQIKNRFTSEVMFDCKLSAEAEGWPASMQLGFAIKKAFSSWADLAWSNLEGADLEGANLEGANLKGSNLAWSNLAGADLAWSNLEGADLEGANLEGANLAWADLAWSNLEGADLEGANLEGANLKGSNLAGSNLAGAVYNAKPEEIARLDAVREIVLAKPERLKMSDWHSPNWTPEHTPEEERACGSAHCMAGWLQANSPDEAMRRKTALDAGRELAPSAYCMFFQSDAVALQWLQDRAYANTSPATKPE